MPPQNSAQTYAQRLFVSIKPGIDIELLIQKLANTMAVVPGFAGLYWGRVVEDEGKCEIICLWDTLQAREAYPSSPQRPKSDYLLWKMSIGIPACHYLPLAPWSSMLSLPSRHSPLVLVEMLSFSQLPVSLPDSTFSPLTSYIKSCVGCMDVIGAPAFQYGDGEGEGRFLIVVGWESVRHHEKAASRGDGFKTLSARLWKRVEMHHVRWEEIGIRGNSNL